MAISYYKANGITGNAVDDAQIIEILGPDAIGYKDNSSSGIDPKTGVAYGLQSADNIKQAEKVGAAAVSAVDNLANKVSGILDSIGSGFKGVYNFIMNYWQLLIIAGVALVVIGSDN